MRFNTIHSIVRVVGFCNVSIYVVGVLTSQFYTRVLFGQTKFRRLLIVLLSYLVQ